MQYFAVLALFQVRHLGRLFEILEVLFVVGGNTWSFTYEAREPLGKMKESATRKKE